MENILDVLEGYLLLECTYEINETQQFNDVRFIDFYNKHSKIKNELCEIYKKQEDLFGGLHFIKYNDKLNIYHTFTKRLNNPGNNKKSLSEEDVSLLNNIKYIVKKAKDDNMKVYIPKYIGTTFSKAHWETLEKEIKNISEDIVFIQ